MFDLLDCHFHIPRPGEPGVWDPEWSDDRVAKETSLDASVVAYFRDAVYGPALNPRIRELQAAIDRLENKYKDELATLLTMQKSLASEMQAGLDLLHSELAALARAEAKGGRP